MITISSICSWSDTGPSHRNFVKGERILKAGHIFKCGKNQVTSQSVSWTGYCLQTSNLRDHPHQIDGTISTSGDILDVKCSCKAGLGGKCKHVIGMLLYLNRHEESELEVFSCTDKTCLWKKSHKETLATYTHFQPLLEHGCYSEKQKKIVLDEEAKTRIEQKLLRDLPASGFTKHETGRHGWMRSAVQGQCSVTPNEDLELLQAIFIYQRSDEMELIKTTVKVNRLKSCCVENLNKLNDDFLRIAVKSKESYVDWKNERKFRITGSNCYGLFTYVNNKNPDWKKKYNTFFEEKQFKKAYTEYGKSKEKEAREVFQEMSNLKVLEIGLIVCAQNPWLGYSPDGVIFQNNQPVALLEIKCPFKGKDMNIAEAIRHEFGQCLVTSGELVTLKKKHRYYGQIQLGMAVLNVKIAYFFVYASADKSFFNLAVPYDVEFTRHMVATLKAVWFNIILHEICIKKGNNKENDENDNNNNNSQAITTNL